MVCQECNQRPAALHFTKIINGEKKEIHICDKCAQEKGDLFMQSGANGFSINNLLAGLLNIEPFLQQKKTSTFPHVEELKCKNCHLTFKEFVHVGKFGCATCYEAFKDSLDPILKRVHGGNTAHVGKIPERLGESIHLRKQIKDLKSELKALIDQEEFEQAALVRDQIRLLEKGDEAAAEERGNQL